MHDESKQQIHKNLSDLFSQNPPRQDAVQRNLEQQSPFKQKSPEEQLKEELVSKLKGEPKANTAKIIEENASIKQLHQLQGTLIPQYEQNIIERLKVIDELRLAKRQLEKNLETFKLAQSNPKAKKVTAV